MNKKQKIIEERIKEIDTSTMVDIETFTLEQTIDKIKEMYKFEEDKTMMNNIIIEVTEKYKYSN